MSDQTLTRTIETAAAPASVLKILEDPTRLPEWAPAFADRVECDCSNVYRVTKGESVFSMEAIVERASGTVDYLREITPGEKRGAYLRVLPRPGGGSVVVMTLPIPPGGNVEQVGAVLSEELAALARLSVL